MADDQFGVYPNVTPDSPEPRRNTPQRNPPRNASLPPINFKMGKQFAKSRWPGVGWYTGTMSTKNIIKDARRAKLEKERIKRKKDKGEFVEEKTEEPATDEKEHKPIAVVVRIAFDPKAGELYLSCYDNEKNVVNDGMKHKFILDPIGYYKSSRKTKEGTIEPMSMTIFPKCGPDFEVLVSRHAPLYEDKAKVYMGQIAQAIH